jgi:hypothetical protein
MIWIVSLIEPSTLPFASHGLQKRAFPREKCGVNELVKPKRLPEQICLAQILLNKKLLKHNLYVMEPLQQPEVILEVIEIELFAIEKKSLPRAKRYIIRVDKRRSPSTP